MASMTFAIRRADPADFERVGALTVQAYIEGQGWFLGFHTFTHYVKVAFFRGTSLRPVPPGASKGKDTRYIDIHEGDELDEAQMATWVKQAAALPGWVPGRPS